MKIAFLATDMVEQVELTEPWKAVEEQGWTAELVSLRGGEIQGFEHYDKADRFRVDRTVDEVSVDDYDGLVVPGGVGNPDELRTSDDAVQFVRDFVESGKPIGVICHGPWVLVEADVVRGVKSRPGRASAPTSRTRAAGGSIARSSSTRASSRAAAPTTCPPSPPSSSRSSGKAGTSGGW